MEIPNGQSEAVRYQWGNQKRKSKKNRRHNAKKGKRTNNDLQNTTYNIKDQATRILLKLGENLDALESPRV